MITIIHIDSEHQMHMQDLSTYHYHELYDMVNHIDAYRHPERLSAIEKEIERRKKQGAIPKQLVPAIRWKDLRFWK